MVTLQFQRPAMGLRPAYVPYFICRVSGLPISRVVRLRSGSSISALHRVREVEGALHRERDALSAGLFTAIGATSDKLQRNHLLALRRDLFNFRLPSPTVQAAACHLPDSLRGRVESVLAMLQLRDELRAEFRSLYDTELIGVRLRLQAELTDPDFQKGLALSSKALFSNLSRYLNAAPDRFGSREEQIERGLVRYFTRMATKATPFGRFCAVIPAEFRSAFGPEEPCVMFTGDPRLKRSAVRLNKRAYAHLWQGLQHRSAIRSTLSVELNPTLSVENDRVVFLTAQGGLEVFQRLDLTDALQIVLDLAAHGSSVGFLMARLAQDPQCDSTAEEARAFVDRLIDLGCLRLRSIVGEQMADWDKPMRVFLASIDDDEATALAGKLGELRDLADRYVAATAADRAVILAEARRLLSGQLGAVPSTRWVRDNPPLYEDATSDARLVVNLTEAVHAALERLAEFVALTLPLAGSRLEMPTMRKFFATYYEEVDPIVGVPLLRFYEDFCREHFKAHLEKVRAVESGNPSPGYDIGNPLRLPSIERLRMKRSSLSTLVQTLWVAAPAAQEITITRGMLESVLGRGGEARLIRDRSVHMFTQLAPKADASHQLVVLHGAQYYTGFGKFFSRFLYLLPSQWQPRILEDNNCSADALFAEICDDAAFNANLHPQMLPWEISYPTGQHSDSACHLLTTDLRVAPDPEDAEALLLRHGPTGRRVWPVDLGFLNPRMRPPLYQLLTRFSPGGYFTFPLPSSPTKDGTPGIVYRPRITYEGLVVLARRTWTVPQASFPTQAAGEEDAEYFARLNSWRLEHGVPERVYVRVRPLPTHPRGAAASSAPTLPVTAEDRDHAAARSSVTKTAVERADPNEASRNSEGVFQAPHRTGGDADGARPSRDWHKPQFVDFGNPLLVRLFARISGGLKHFSIILEECLPPPNALPLSEGEPYAVELVLQLGFRQDAGVEACGHS